MSIGPKRFRRTAPIVVILAVLLSGCASSSKSPTTTSSTTTSTSLPPGLEGSDANALPAPPGARSTPSFPNPSTPAGRKQFLAAVFTDAQRLWAGLFSQAGVAYRPARLVFFTSNVNTSCGPATAEVGPFYCTGDQSIYLDTRFFDTLEQQFGASLGTAAR